MANPGAVSLHQRDFVEYLRIVKQYACSPGAQTMLGTNAPDSLIQFKPVEQMTAEEL